MMTLFCAVTATSARTNPCTDNATTSIEKIIRRYSDTISPSYRPEIGMAPFGVPIKEHVVAANFSRLMHGLIGLLRVRDRRQCYSEIVTVGRPVGAISKIQPVQIGDHPDIRFLGYP